MKQQYSDWRKSSHSNPDADCIEAGRAPLGRIAVRDTKQFGTGPVLEFGRTEWAAFLRGCKEHDGHA
ncbi:hypothetical protein Acsp03_28330 [Actinomadura sp. NBRC 104412]|uniref:DUF397 domain-containing protein n=1 Tax=Actinomadura sp. NBRC 104412 TaxID=3032203 RepID=UPI0024A37875|nr:DUF397 domain-containing protein [Actinomadura sp. NBRC 104412]GLZ05367.1 hypothetical protein Acsp03_28330 [Actinomadura sp. NBRC 104412]